ncbi:acetyl-CoA hydrolase/transferase C-terminal domain-containing protein [Deferribacterales bacterium RsTz2092]|nr:acetyl-CoA hydrolase [Deferribacterales bacterium]
MSEFENRIKDKSLLSKVVKDPKDLIKFFTTADKKPISVGWSGFTPAGYPKLTPKVIADYVEEKGLQGKWKFDVYTGASVGADTDGRWAELQITNKRWPYQTAKAVSAAINKGEIKYGDKHLSTYAQDLLYGFYGELDYVFVEASEIDEKGNIVPTAAVGASPAMIKIAKNIIVEVNTAIPNLKGMHDIYVPELPPHRKPIPITHSGERVGTEYIPTDKSKIVAIVESTLPDRGRALKGAGDDEKAIANHIVDFLSHEVKAGRLPKNLLPLQSGVGGIANAVVEGLTDSPFEDLTVYTEVLQDSFLPFLKSGKCKMITATSLSLSEDGFKDWWKDYTFYKDKVILRPQEITNHPEVVRRLGVIAMNTPLEMDFYGHANSTLASGTKMQNGIGGSNDFLRNGWISIMHGPSARPSKSGDQFGISCIVPKVTHVDQTEHDLSILVTEQGLADLRGLAPRQRVPVVIEKCAHPAYKDYLKDYFKRAYDATKGNHEPQLLEECYKMHINLAKNGTMRFWEAK